MKFLIFALCIVAASCDLVLLTPEQGVIVTSSWNQVKHNEVDILYNVFKSYPEIQNKFSQFVGKDLDDIKNSSEFAVHATRIISFMTEIIGLADSESNVAASKLLINGLASNHKNRGVSKAQFNEFRASIVSYLQSHVASWNDNASTAWARALDNAYFILFSALDGNPL
jgi:hypothetical protein